MTCPTQYDFDGYVYEDGSATLHGTLVDQDRARTPLVNADITSIHYTVFKSTDQTVSVDNVELTVADVLEDSLDTYKNNFHVTLPATAFPEGDINYIVEFTIVLASGYTRKLKGIVFALETGTGTGA